MKTHMSGFTIIEVTLFLAISGLLGIGILAAASNSLNNQRYQDSVRSLHSELQAQYSNALNVQNDRSGSALRCNQNGTIIDTTVSGGTAESRGTSVCTIVGRVVDVIGNGSRTVRSQPVYATADPMADPVPPTSDVTALRRSLLVIAPTTTDPAGRSTYGLEWQTSLATPAGARQEIRLLIVRSPFSGMMRTYAVTGSTLTATTNATIRAMIGSVSEVTACVNPDGLSAGQELGVRIVRDASSASGVILLPGGVC